MANIKVYTPIDKEDDTIGEKVFLAGTIDDGNSVNWQKEVIEALGKSNYVKRDITIYNPRRANWGPLEQDALEKQITWELEHQEKCDLNLMVLKADSKSPVSLMELGLFARSGKLVVLCPETFYRFENVRVTCMMYDVDLYYKDKDFSVEEIVEILEDELKERDGMA